MDLTPFLSAFLVITIAELGDKTQLTVVTLCAERKPLIIFFSSFLALLGVGGVSIFIGSTLARFLPMFWVKIGSGVAFVIFGIYTFLEDTESSYSCEEATFVASFSLVAMMELGDKTQLATIALATRFSAPFLVFLGMGLAFLLITGVGVLMGTKLRDLLPRKYIKTGSALMFISLGTVFLLGTVTGIRVF